MITVGDLATRNLTTAEMKTTVAAALALMQRDGIHHLPVLGPMGDVRGVATDVGAMARIRAGDASAWVVQIAEEVKARCEPHEPAARVFLRQRQAGADYTLVVSPVGRPIGVFTERDAARWCLQALAPEVPVSAWMTAGPPVAVDGRTEADRALDLMRDRGIRHLVVIAPDDPLAGVVSHRDLVARDNQPVARFLSAPPHVTRPDASIHDALRTMLDHDVGCLPVVDDRGAPVGIFTRADALRALHEAVEAIEAQERSHLPP